MNDIDLKRRLRDARPDLPERGAPLTETAESTMRQIMASDKLEPRRRRPAIYLSVAAALAVFLVVAVGTFFATRPAPVYAAATPPLLEVTPVEGSSKDLLMQLSNELKDTSKSTIRFQSWSLSMTVGDDSTIESVAIEPELRTVEHSHTGSRIEVRRGDPYDSLGNPIEVDGYEVGELIWEQDFKPGEFPFVHGEPPTTAEAFGPYLQQASGQPELTSGEYLLELNSLLGERSLSTEQTRAALEFLALQPDIETEGQVVDRLGRSGISFATSGRSPDEYVDRIVVATDEIGRASCRERVL